MSFSHETSFLEHLQWKKTCTCFQAQEVNFWIFLSRLVWIELRQSQNIASDLIPLLTINFLSHFLCSWSNRFVGKINNFNFFWFSLFSCIHIFFLEISGNLPTLTHFHIQFNFTYTAYIYGKVVKEFILINLKKRLI